MGAGAASGVFAAMALDDVGEVGGACVGSAVVVAVAVAGAIEDGSGVVAAVFGSAGATAGGSAPWHATAMLKAANEVVETDERERRTRSGGIAKESSNHFDARTWHFGWTLVGRSRGPWRSSEGARIATPWC
jgi:hypothetical protein